MLPSLAFGEIADFDVSKPDVAVVVLQQQMAFHTVAETGYVLEFAFGNAGFHLLAATFILENLHAIEPMLDMISLNQNA